MGILFRLLDIKQSIMFDIFLINHAKFSEACLMIFLNAESRMSMSVLSEDRRLSNMDWHLGHLV